MKRLISIIALTSISYTNIYASKNTETLDTLSISEVVVTGARNAIDIRHLSQTVSSISLQTIKNYNQPSLMPIVNEQVPGLFVTSRGVMGYGVSGGAAGSISLRGLSGSQGRMMVLIDGHPQYAGIFGHPISDAYQSMLAEKIEVLRGPASVIYGSNAMGGVMNIVTRKMNHDGVNTNIHLGYGSYNTLESEFTNRIKKGKFSSIISGSYNSTDGHRENMNFEQYGGYAKLGYQLSNNWNTYADANITHFNASYPGPTSAPLLEGDQRITRGVTSLAIENKYDRTSGAVSFFYNWGDHWINDGYTPSAGETPQEGRFNSFDDMMGISVYQSAQLFAGNRITLGFDWFRYGGEAYTEFIKGANAGTQRSLVDKHETEIAGYTDIRQTITSWLTANAGLRFDHHSRVGSEWIPQAGLAFHLPNSIEIKTTANKGFRYPILREMYMFPPQNPDLKPESMWNYEVAFSQHLLAGRLSYGINLFHINGKNLILTLPNPNGSGRLNQNSGEIRNSGFELTAAYKINSNWKIDANYSFLDMKSPVVAAPEHKAYIGANYSHGKWQIATGVQHIAGLYTSTSPVAKENFTLWNARVSYQTNRWLQLWARGENLLAQRYEINVGYPMPKATAMLGINLNL